MGKQSTRSSNGFDKFFNQASDTIYFKNNSQLNNSWTFINLSSGEKIVAMVQSINIETILGFTDSVKTISLHATDSLGNNISNIFNGKFYKVGKSFGLISGYSFHHIPTDTIPFSIVGIENPTVGMSSEELTAQQVFDYNVGDRFDFSFSHNTEPAYHDRSCISRTVISKQIYGIDSVIYFYREKREWYGNNFNNYYSGYSDDSIKEKIIFSQYKYLNAKPFQWFYQNTWGGEGGEVWLTNSIYSLGKTTKEYFPEWNNINDTCLTSMLWFCLGIQQRFAGGLGMTHTSYNEGGCSGFDTLSYYNKNGIEWGDSLHCFPTGIYELNFQSTVNLFPNPANENIFVTGNFSPTQTQFILLNCLGEEIKCKVNANNGSVSIDISLLPSGFYFLIVGKEKEFAYLKFIKN